jgi:hypothetical protein
LRWLRGRSKDVGPNRTGLPKSCCRKRHPDDFGSTPRPVAEGFIEHEMGAGGTYSALAGAIWWAWDSLSFDAAVRRGREAGVTLTEPRAGLTLTVDP